MPSISFGVSIRRFHPDAVLVAVIVVVVLFVTGIIGGAGGGASGGGGVLGYIPASAALVLIGDN